MRVCHHAGDNCDNGYIDDVIMYKIGKIRKVIFSLIVKLERWSKAENVETLLGYVDVIRNFQYTFQLKCHMEFKIAVNLKICKYFRHFYVGQILTKFYKLCRKSVFYTDDVTDDVTVWQQTQSSIFMVKSNALIFHYNAKTNLDMTTNIYLRMYRGHVTMPVENTDNGVINNVIM